MGLSWQTLRSLEHSFGESFYLLDIRKFERNYRDFLGCFQAIYPNASIGYSYKTNYIPRVCQAVRDLGGYAEVVSQMEYDLAARIGVPASRIIYNGPLKTPEDIERAILAGSIVNLDSLEEADVVAALARRMPARPFGVGLRCNFDIGGARISRFGLDVAAGDIDAVLRLLTPFPSCGILGLHCHYSTAERSIESFGRRMRGLIEWHDAHFKRKPLRFLDVGGGYFGHMSESLRRQFPCHVPSYQEYADAIAPAMKSRFPVGGPELILEPGVALVSDVLQFVAKVIGVKTVRGRRVALIVGSVHNVKPTGTDKKLAMTHYRSNSPRDTDTPTDIVGYTCMEHDCLYDAYEGDVRPGDYVVFDNVGAYTVVFKPPFIRPNPPIVTFDSQSGEHTLSRRAETFADVFAAYTI